MITLAYIIIVLSVALIIIVFINPSFHPFSSSLFDPNLANLFGGFIGGVTGPLLTVSSILLILKTIKDQKHEKTRFQLQSIVFELLKYNREIVNGFEYIDSNDPNKEIQKGEKYFIYAKRQIEMAINDVRYLLPENDKMDHIKIGYSIFYFGCGYESRPILCEEISRIIEKNKAEDVIKKLKTKKTEYDTSILFYGGHQNRLSHYFRQLYYLITMVDNSSDLPLKEKMNLCKLIRVQMGNYEQALLFYNSLSSLGIAWKKASNGNVTLLEKYELIKNIPPDFIKEVNVKEIYPNIDYEFSYLIAAKE